VKKIRQSFVWWSALARKDYSPQQVAAAAREIGYDAMEMCKPEELHIIRDAGLEIALIIGHQSLADGMNNPENHSRIADELAASIDLAAEWGVRVLCCFSGNRREGLSDLQGAEFTAEILARMAPAAERAGCLLCPELLNSKVDHAGYMCDRTEWGVHVCKMVNSPAVKLVYDIYHMQIMEGDLIRTIQDNVEWIGHFHTAGNPGRNDMDDAQEIYYPPIARAIAELDYDGYVAHEFVPKGDTIEAMRAAYEIFDVA
jgi:hydroxypyruvate isomerase